MHILRSLILVALCLRNCALVSASPSTAQASSAAVAAGAGVGNSLIAAALLDFIDDLAALADAIIKGIELGIEELWEEIVDGTGPELQYSYGRSPPVYPTRKCYHTP